MQHICGVILKNAAMRFYLQWMSPNVNNAWNISQNTIWNYELFKMR
jgi:hypothetical protein